jgi:hypothetical protein
MGSTGDTSATYPPADSTLSAELIPYNRHLRTLVSQQPMAEIIGGMVKTDLPTAVSAALSRALATANLAEGLNAEESAFRDRPALPGVEDNDLIAHFFGVARDVYYLLSDGETARAQEKLDLAYDLLVRERQSRHSPDKHKHKNV